MSSKVFDAVENPPPVNVLCTRDFSDQHLAKLRGVSPRLQVTQTFCRNAGEVTRALTPETEVLFTSFAPESLDHAGGLRWVQMRNAGIDHVIGTPIWGNTDILITKASGFHGTIIGEYVIGMMVALTRRFPLMQEFQRKKEWPLQNRASFFNRELRGATLGIIGYGSIGRELARMGKALGMHIIAAKRDPRQRNAETFMLPGTGDPTGEIPEALYGMGEIDALLSQADYVVITAASTPASLHLMNEGRLRQMRKDAFLINIARGEIVDEHALAAALRGGWIAGAALDVFEQEPLPPESPLWNLENLILTPHISGFTLRHNDHTCEIFSENLRRYLAGQPLLNHVDRRKGY